MTPHLPGLSMAAALLAVAALALPGCNDQVFVKPLPDFTTVPLSPAGDSICLDIGADGAGFLGLSITGATGDDATIWRLSASGDTVGITGDPTVDLPGGLAISSPWSPNARLRVMATTDGKVTVELGHCYSTSPAEGNLYVTYPYGTVTIPLRVDAIEPFEARSIVYPHGFSVRPDDEIDESESVVVDNQSADTLSFVMEPYTNATARVTFRQAEGTQRLPTAEPGAPLPVPVPGADGVPAVVSGTLSAPYLPGVTSTIAVEGLPDVRVRIKMPPYTRRRYTVFIERRIITAPYTVELRSPSLTGGTTASGTVTVGYPVNYLLGYNDL